MYVETHTNINAALCPLHLFRFHTLIEYQFKNEEIIQSSTALYILSMLLVV